MPIANLVVPTVGIRPLAARLADGAALQTELADCLVRLYTSDMPTPNEFVTATSIAASEADYTGYTAGGIEVATVGEPYVDDDGLVYVTVPSQQFNRGATLPGVDNTIGWAGLVDAAGVLRALAPLPENVVMDGPGKSIVVTFSLLVA